MHNHVTADGNASPFPYLLAAYAMPVLCILALPTHYATRFQHTHTCGNIRPFVACDGTGLSGFAASYSPRFRDLVALAPHGTSADIRTPGRHCWFTGFTLTTTLLSPPSGLRARLPPRWWRYLMAAILPHTFFCSGTKPARFFCRLLQEAAPFTIYDLQVCSVY